MSDLALVLHQITKRFGDVAALASASLTVRRGTLHAVLGENGAGKTTLMRIAYGLLRRDTGRIDIDGRTVAMTSGAEAIQRGLGMVHQHFSLVPALTVAENIALGGHGPLHLYDVVRRVRELSERTGLAIDPAARVDALGVGAQQRVEILKALYRSARLLILDEPTAVLTPRESDELFVWIRRFVSNGGTVVLVTHKLNEALALADDVTVLRRGATVVTAPASTLTIDALVRAMTGDERANISPVRRHRAMTRGSCVAQLRGTTVRDARGVIRVRESSLDLHGGEVVGLAGVEGSGVHEVVRLLAGRLPPTSGSVTLPATIGFIPEDRLRDAVIAPFSLTENFALRGAETRRGRLYWRQLAHQTAGIMVRHDVRATSAADRLETLSGGNQQKFVVGRELDEQPALVVAENPVRGLDIRASEHVMRELGTSAANGSAVVLYSADVDELLPFVDRMLVVFSGVVREVPVERSAVAAALVGAA